MTNVKAKKMLFFVLVTALGLWAMGIQKDILDSGFDSAGLLITKNPKLWLVWIVTVIYLCATALQSWKLGRTGSYEDHFSPCFFSGTASVLAGLLMMFSGINGMVPGQMLISVCAFAAGCAMEACGVCRIFGRKPVWWLDFLVFCGYGVYLVLSYRNWNINPQLQRFAFELLACAALTLFSLHRARCAVDVMERRKMVFFGFAGLYLCFLAMPGAENPGFYFASGLWCAGGMCELQRMQAPAPVPEQKLPPETEV